MKDDFEHSSALHCSTGVELPEDMPVCATCSMQSIGPGELRIWDNRKWLCSPIPCPECRAATGDSQLKTSTDSRLRVHCIVIGHVDDTKRL